MYKVNNDKLKRIYYNKYNLEKVFDVNMYEYIELFSFEKYEHICTQNEKLEYIFFFVDGKAKVYSTLSNGKSLLLCFYAPFEILGDLEFIKFKNEPANVQALEQSFCIGINMDIAREKLLTDITFLKYICSTLGEKLERISFNSSINLLYKLENRLARYIKATMIKNNENKYIFEENLTHLSELLGTSYRHLLRCLSSLCDNEVLIKKDNMYEVKSIEKLEKLAVEL